MAHEIIICSFCGTKNAVSKGKIKSCSCWQCSCCSRINDPCIYESEPIVEETVVEEEPVVEEEVATPVDEVATPMCDCGATFCECNDSWY